MEFIGNVPQSRLVKQKLIAMSDIVHSQLFLNAECRAILLPSILARIKELLVSSDEVCALCIKIYLNYVFTFITMYANNFFSTIICIYVYDNYLV